MLEKIITMFRFIRRQVTLLLQSPIGVFFLFWIFLYSIDIKYILLKANSSQKASSHRFPMEKDDIFSDKSPNIIRNIQDNHVSNHGDLKDVVQTGNETNFYEEKLKKLRPIDTSKDVYLKNITSTICQFVHEEGKNTCPCIPHTLYGRLPVPSRSPSWSYLISSHPEVIGGHFKPRDCQARVRVSIIIPHRDRGHHIPLFLYHMHPILQRMNLEYRIIVVEQSKKGVFNKALMMNAGYKQSKKIWEFDCVIFHDVDMLVEDDRNLYYCADTARHLGAYVDKFAYQLRYKDIFGGVIALTTDQFELINGFSNKYFGWGGEDDDMSKRVREYEFEIDRPPHDVARYHMIPHATDTHNPMNSKRRRYYDVTADDIEADGLSSLAYNLVKIEDKKIYLWILIDLVCPMNAKADMGMSTAPKMKTVMATLRECRKLCSEDTRCLAVSWNETNNSCIMHSKLKKLKSHSSIIYLKKDCSLLENIDVEKDGKH